MLQPACATTLKLRIAEGGEEAGWTSGGGSDGNGGASSSDPSGRANDGAAMEVDGKVDLNSFHSFVHPPSSSCTYPPT